MPQDKYLPSRIRSGPVRHLQLKIFQSKRLTLVDNGHEYHFIVVKHSDDEPELSLDQFDSKAKVLRFKTPYRKPFFVVMNEINIGSKPKFRAPNCLMRA